MSEEGIEMLRIKLASNRRINVVQAVRNAALLVFLWAVCVLAVVGIVALCGEIM